MQNHLNRQQEMSNSILAEPGQICTHALLSFTNYDRNKCILSTNYDRNKCFQNVTIANEELVNQSVQRSTEHQL